MLKLISFSFLFLGTLLFFSACNNTDNTRATQSKKGKVLFQKYCVSCHGETGIGDGIAANDQTIKPSNLTLILKERKTSQFPIGEIARYIDGRATIKSHGTRDMPIWGTVLMQEEQLQNNDELKGKLGEIIAYLMSIQEY